MKEDQRQALRRFEGQTDKILAEYRSACGFPTSNGEKLMLTGSLKVLLFCATATMEIWRTKDS